DPEKVEADVMAIFPKSEWTMLSHRVVFHGRRDDEGAEQQNHGEVHRGASGCPGGPVPAGAVTRTWRGHVDRLTGSPARTAPRP
ncbi:hypothetical protein ACWEO1_37550, partial [Kitasatospora cineracea]